MEKETNTTLAPEITEASTAGETRVSQGEVAEPTGNVAAKENTEIQRADATKEEDISVSGSVGEGNPNSAKPSERSEMKAEFERLIKGDYKEFYEERLKENLNRRFRESAQKRQRNAENSEIAQLLYDRYNIAEGDVTALKSAIESDTAYLAAEADKRGMSIEDYKYIRKLETENRHFHARQAEYEAVHKANEAVNKWYAESQTVRESYPEFDIFSESKNPAFVSLLKSGIDVKTAYEVVHHSELVTRAADAAAREAEKKTADAIRQRAQRPAENGLSSGSSAILKNNVSSLSAKDREDIARRAARGEKITF